MIRNQIIRTLRVFLLLLIIGTSLLCQGFDGPIKVRRVCLDANDSIATLFFNQLNNGCGTFTKVELYGRVVKTNPTPFILLKTEVVLPGNTMAIKQQDLKQWEYFMRFYTMCDGITTFDSDTTSVDIFPPTPTPLDSVSVNQTTQKIVVGWSKNPSPDHKGYLVFRQTGGNNVQISNQIGEGYTDPNSNPQFGALSYSHNSFDSCNNINTISNPHVSMFLSRTFDFCKREIGLTWSPYIGWTTDKYYIYQALNAGGYTIIDSTSSTSYTVKQIIPGGSYCFFIRSKKLASSFTSSSNRVCQAIPNPPIPQNTRIKSVSVQDDNTMRIKWYTEQSDQAKSAEIYRGTTTNNLVSLGQITFSNGDNYYLDPIDTKESAYFYRIIVYDSCAQDNDTSTIAKSVFLSKSQNDELEWNSFIFSQDTNDGDHIFTESSTWNLTTIIPPSLQGQLLLLNHPDSPFCYQIVSISKLGDSSISNTICIELALNVYIPNAIQLNGTGKNSVFGVYGTGIDWDKSSIFIYTRWGEKIHELSGLNKTWNATYRDKQVQAGIYMYNGIIFGKRDEKQAVKGTILILD